MYFISLSCSLNPLTMDHAQSILTKKAFYQNTFTVADTEPGQQEINCAVDKGLQYILY